VLNGAMTVDPNAAQNDPAVVKIRSCGQFLNTMLRQRRLADDPSFISPALFARRRDAELLVL